MLVLQPYPIGARRQFNKPFIAINILTLLLAFRREQTTIIDSDFLFFYYYYLKRLKQCGRRKLRAVRVIWVGRVSRL